MATEEALVRNCINKIEDVAHWIQYADAKTCPLLKECAMEYFVARAKGVMKTESFKTLKQSPRLMEELLLAATVERDGRLADAVNMLSVNDLRMELNHLEMDVDGSKEMLVRRLNRNTAVVAYMRPLFNKLRLRGRCSATNRALQANETSLEG